MSLLLLGFCCCQSSSLLLAFVAVVCSWLFLFVAMPFKVSFLNCKLSLSLSFAMVVAAIIYLLLLLLLLSFSCRPLPPTPMQDKRRPGSQGGPGRPGAAEASVRRSQAPPPERDGAGPQGGPGQGQGRRRGHRQPPGGKNYLRDLKKKKSHLEAQLLLPLSCRATGASPPSPSSRTWSTWSGRRRRPTPSPSGTCTCRVGATTTTWCTRPSKAPPTLPPSPHPTNF